MQYSACTDTVKGRSAFAGEERARPRPAIRPFFGRNGPSDGTIFPKNEARWGALPLAQQP